MHLVLWIECLENQGFLYFISLSQMFYQIPHNIIIPSWMAKKRFHNTAIIMQKSRTNDTHHCLINRMVKSTIVSSFPFHEVTFPALWSNSMRPLLLAKYQFKYSHFKTSTKCNKRSMEIVQARLCFTVAHVWSIVLIKVVNYKKGPVLVLNGL